MDAPSKTEELTRSRRSQRLERIAIACLATVLAIGLWQSYGAWLFSGRAEHAF